MCHINDLRLVKLPAESPNEDSWWLKSILFILSGMLFCFAILVCALDYSIQWLRSKNDPARIVLEDYEVVSNENNDDEDAVSFIESPGENDNEFNFLEYSSSEEVPEGLGDVEWIVRICPRLQRPVMTAQGFHVAIHQEWSHPSNRMEMEDCVECFGNQ
ncbi:hypothetical protein L3Y34_016105 [Caenorhabditis briggsae]|uniref:Uncharacterized protein n=1 Tax=Caenorhabditis briggsae TaxID=6238 RepID=A0AAE9DY64_CAEBR|nr:hypothetical protein L3Y34_016105 [Caenorhabditis briggsae]